MSLVHPIRDGIIHCAAHTLMAMECASYFRVYFGSLCDNRPWIPQFLPNFAFKPCSTSVCWIWNTALALKLPSGIYRQCINFGTLIEGDSFTTSTRVYFVLDTVLSFQQCQLFPVAFPPVLHIFFPCEFSTWRLYLKLREKYCLKFSCEIYIRKM